MVAAPRTDPAAGLLLSLNRSPVCAVLRPPSLAWAEAALTQLTVVGVCHVELAWRPDLPHWQHEARRLQESFPAVALGAASVCTLAGVEAAAAAGLAYAVSPVLDEALQAAAAACGLLLVPGVMTPSEVHRARVLGCPLVKLFPAAALGPGYWRQLRQPLGAPLPRVLAAGGLQVGDVLPWLAAGVDAVALGGGLFREQQGMPLIEDGLVSVMADLARRSADDGAG